MLKFSQNFIEKIKFFFDTVRSTIGSSNLDLNPEFKQHQTPNDNGNVANNRHPSVVNFILLSFRIIAIIANIAFLIILCIMK